LKEGIKTGYLLSIEGDKNMSKNKKNKQSVYCGTSNHIKTLQVEAEDVKPVKSKVVESILVCICDVESQDKKIIEYDKLGYQHYESVCIPGSSEMILRFRKH